MSTEWQVPVDPTSLDLFTVDARCTRPEPRVVARALIYCLALPLSSEAERLGALFTYLDLSTLPFSKLHPSAILLSS